ncbi:MAG: peptidoglycan-associated lipoprotein Pal [Acidobacteriota bacterium]
MGSGFTRSLLVTALLGACLVPALACRSAPPAEPPSSTPPTFEQAPRRAEPVDETVGFPEAETEVEPIRETPQSLADRLMAQGAVKRIHFDFDKYDLRPDALQVLRENAAALKQYSELKVRIEGHCDERGTVEYNLALGEKRARAARDYLVSAGIPARRLSIISFGKERPLDTGHNERAWALNRRAEFILYAE